MKPAKLFQEFLPVKRPVVYIDPGYNPVVVSG
jgi:hypothetical protein